MRKLYSLVACLIFLASCEPKFDTPVPSAGSADFSTYVAIGSNFSSGFSDGALTKYGQKASFPNLLAQQMQLAGGADTFRIPYLKGEKGVYPSDDYGVINYRQTLPRFKLYNKEDCKGETGLTPERIDTVGDNEIDLDDATQRIDSGAAVIYHHLGIPSMKSTHLTSPGYGEASNHGTNKSFNPFFWRFAQEPLVFSAVYLEALAAHPTFFTYELGMSDVLSYALDGGLGSVPGTYDEDITATADFRIQVSSVLDALIADGATGVIANVPDVTVFPYFTVIEYDALELDTAEADSMNALFPSIGYTFHEGEHNPFVIREDNVVRTIKSTERILLGIPVDSLKCEGMGKYFPIEDLYVLSETEVASVQSFTAEYNAVIDELAAERGMAVVDLAAFMRRIHNEVAIEGIDYTAEFVSGGFFSLDGLHPTDRGQALIANEFIKVINSHYGAQLPLLNPSAYPGVLFP